MREGEIGRERDRPMEKERERERERGCLCVGGGGEKAMPTLLTHAVLVTPTSQRPSDITAHSNASAWHWLGSLSGCRFDSGVFGFYFSTFRVLCQLTLLRRKAVNVTLTKHFFLVFIFFSKAR